MVPYPLTLRISNVGIEERYILTWVSQVALVIKNPPANAGAIRGTGSVPGSGRSPGGEHGKPLQYSCLENLMKRSLAGYSPESQRVEAI